MYMYLWSAKLDSAFSRFKRPLPRQDDEGCRLTHPNIERESIPGTSSIPLSNVCSFSISFYCDMAKMEDSETPMAATLAGRYISFPPIQSAYYSTHFTDTHLQAPTSTGTPFGTSSPALHSHVLAVSSKTTLKSPTPTSKSPQAGTSGCEALALPRPHYRNRYRMSSANVI